MISIQISAKKVLALTSEKLIAIEEERSRLVSKWLNNRFKRRTFIEWFLRKPRIPVTLIDFDNFHNDYIDECGSCSCYYCLSYENQENDKSNLLKLQDAAKLALSDNYEAMITIDLDINSWLE